MGLYFLAILPPEAIREEIALFKFEIAERFNACHALKLPAHVTLHKPFKLRKSQEEYLLESLQQFAKSQSAFTLYLNNFGSFTPRVIYVDVENKEPVKIFRELLLQQLSSAFSMIDQDCRFHPHLTIATRDLNQSTFSKAWEEFKNRKYDAVFQVDRFSLLKHNGRNWEVISDFFLS